MLEQKNEAVNIIFPHSSSWVILSPIEQRIKEKIEKVGVPLKNWDIQINYGIKTGCNEAFIIDKTKRDELIKQSPNSVDIIRPILRGRDIKRYGYDFADTYLLNVHNGIREKGIPPINIDDYPAVKAHLDQYWDKISIRDDRGKTPYNLRNCAYMDDFNKQKIIWGNLNLQASYSLAPEGILINAPATMIVPASKYLLCILNSKLADYYIRNLGVTRNGGYFEYKPIFIGQLPIPYPADNSLFLEFDDSALCEYTNEIDNIVYKLYHLNNEEREYIDSISP